jgi:hypothetical protein
MKYAFRVWVALWALAGAVLLGLWCWHDPPDTEAGRMAILLMAPCGAAHGAAIGAIFWFSLCRLYDSFRPGKTRDPDRLP